MPMEIERKFVARVTNPDALVGYPTEEIVQGYIVVGGTEVRIRRNERGNYYLAVKKGDGIARPEVEVRVGKGEDGEEHPGEELLAMAGSWTCEKTRTFALRWEIDVFHGRHDGLVLAEVEYGPDEDTDGLPPRPAGLVLLYEVTNDKAYKNQSICQRDTPHP